MDGEKELVEEKSDDTKDSDCEKEIDEEKSDDEGGKSLNRKVMLKRKVVMLKLQLEIPLKRFYWFLTMNS
jgi:hypothetical protein